MSENKVVNVTAKMIADLARDGNKNAMQIFDSALNYLSIGIVNLINVFDPKKVLVGGGVALNGDIFFDNLNMKVAQNMMSCKEHFNRAGHFWRKCYACGCVCTCT
jgi:glucokinase